MRFISDVAPEPIGPYPHARKAGGLIFLSSVGPRKRGTNEIPGVIFAPRGHVIDYDLEKQTESAIANIRIVLEEAGSSMDRIIDICAFVSDLKNNYKKFFEVYGRYFKTETGPTLTTVEVANFPTPVAVELKVIAEA